MSDKDTEWKSSQGMKFCNLSSVSCPHIRPSLSSPAISAFPPKRLDSGDILITQLCRCGCIIFYVARTVIVICHSRPVKLAPIADMAAEFVSSFLENQYCENLALCAVSSPNDQISWHAIHSTLPWIVRIAWCFTGLLLSISMAIVLSAVFFSPPPIDNVDIFVSKAS